MARTPTEGLQNDIRVLLRTNPKGLSIEEISTRLSISRTTTAKYLNAMEQTGQIESRPYGPAKVFTLAERIPLENIVSLLPHLILTLDDSFTIRQVNDSLLEFFHLEKADLVGKEIRYSPLGSYINENRLEILNQAMEGVPQYIEEDITIDTDTTYFFVRIIPTIFEHGGKGIVLIFEDITVIKETQSHLEELVEVRTFELEKVNKKLCDENAKYRKVRDQLKLKEHQYEQLVESSTDLILKFSSEGVLTYSNPVAAVILGIDPSRKKKYLLKGTCFPDISVHQDFAESLISSLMNDPDLVRKKEIEYPDEKNSLWISWTFRSIPAPSGSHLEILCIGTDISERMLSERLHIESENQLSAILSHLPDPTFVINDKKQIVFWNQAMEEMTGVGADIVIGKERAFFTPSIFGYSRPILADLIFDPDNAAIQSHFQNLTVEEGVLTAETEGVGRTGEKVFFWVKASALKDDSGKMIGAIQSMRDISLMRNLGNSLIESEGQIRGILDVSKDLIVVLDQNKCYTYVNAAYETIFTCTNKEIRGKSIVDHPLPGEPEFWNRTIHSVIQTRLSNRVEVNYSGESGETCLDCYLIPYFPGTSGKMQILLDFRDITVLKGGSISLWEEESTLQEIGKQVSRLVPTLNMNSWIAPIPLIVVLLLAFTGNYF